MSASNFCSFIGNLTKDPEGRDVNAKGETKRVLSFSIAVNTRRNKDKDKQDVTYVDLEAWGKTAEVIENNLAKGDRIKVDGEYKVDVYPHKETGENVYRSKFNVNEVEFIKVKKFSDAPNPAPEPEQPPASKSTTKKSSAKRPAPAPEPEDDGDEDDSPIPF